jgi:hypothetical protein
MSEIKQYTYPEKVCKTNIIYYQLMPGKIRLILGSKKMDFEHLKSALNTYLLGVNNLKGHALIKVNQQELNSKIRIKICDFSCTVGFSFRLYNEIVETLKLDLPTYNRTIYSKQIP